jgi:DHA2 family multidrug resistance protein
MGKVNKWIVAISVVLPTLLEVIDTSVVNVSLNHIRGSLSAGVDEATWTVTAYLVSNAIIIPMTGWLCSVFGRKRYLMFSVVLFTFSSFMCGSATSLAMLVFFRIVQGIGGGALQPLSQAILLEAFPPAEYGMAMAMFGVGVMFGPIAGPVMGGWITDNWSWPWVFYVNIPIGIISIIMITIFIHDPAYVKKLREKIDYWGLGLIVVGIGALQIVLDKGQREDWFSSAFITRLAIIAVVSLVLFVIVELRIREPILNLREFKNIPYASANIIQFFVFFVLFGSIILLPIFLQSLMGYNAFLAGMALAPGGVATLIMMPIVGKLTTKINPKYILFLGLVILGYSMVMMIRFNLSIDFQMAALPRIVMGFGMAMVFVPLMSMAFATIPKEEMGNATSIFALLRNIAGSFGIAIMTTILAQRVQFHNYRFVEHLNLYDPRYQMALHNATALVQAKTGVANEMAANGLIYQRLMQESNLFSFTDAYYIAAVIIACILPLVFLLKRPIHSASPVMAH